MLFNVFSRSQDYSLGVHCFSFQMSNPDTEVKAELMHLSIYERQLKLMSSKAVITPT